MSTASRARQPSAALSPRAARVFYAAADAWFPPGAEGGADGAAPGAGDLDVVAFLGPHVAAGERPGLERILACLELSPRLLLHARRGFSWLSRDERRAWLARGERSGWRWIAEALGRLRSRAESAYRDALSDAGREETPGARQSVSGP